MAFLARGWSSFYNNQPSDAIQAVRRFTRSQNPSTRWHAHHIRARSLWHMGDQASQQQALALWTQISQESRGNPFATARVEIGRALHASAKGQSQQAIDILERLRRQQLPSAATLEAAIELSLLYAEAKRPADALSQLDAADAILKYSESNGIPGVMHNAFLRGVRQATESVKNPGRALFTQAKGLQREGKHANALAMFIQVVRDYPESDFAHRSQLEIGRCHLSMDKPQLAVQHWRQFIASAPAGPWRGQALTALIDLYLIEQLDIKEAGTYADLARTSLPSGLAGPASKASWEEAAYDVQMRIGLVSFCQSQHVQAVEAFTQAKQRTTNKSLVERLDALIAGTEAKQPVIPADCVGAASGIAGSQAGLALSMGMIHFVAGQRDLADSYFDRVLGTPAVAAKTGVPAQPAKPGLRDATPTQRSFALFGKAAVLQAHRKQVEAKDQFIASIQAFAGGSWHDETLYRIATLTQDIAFAQFGRGEPTDKERLANLAKARAEALPYWQQVAQRYPQSPRAEVALYQTGVLLYEQAETPLAVAADRAGEESVRRWRETASVLKQFCGKYPSSVLAGDAYLRQLDIALEKLFDVKQAQELSPAAAQWARDSDKLAAVPSLPLWAAKDRIWQAMDVKQVRYECLLRSALSVYLAGQYDQAIEWVQLAGPKKPKEGFMSNPDMSAISLHYLLKAIQERKQVTEQRAMDAAQNDQQRLLLQLGDLYLEIVRPDKAEQVFLQFINHAPRLGKVPTALEGYAMLQIATSLDRQQGRRPEALMWLQKIVDRQDLKITYWGGLGMFRLAVFTFNQTKDFPKSINIYDKFIRDYPSHENIDLAMAQCCFIAVMMGDNVLAQKYYNKLITIDPNSDFAELLRKKIDEIPGANKN